MVEVLEECVGVTKGDSVNPNHSNRQHREDRHRKSACTIIRDCELFYNLWII